MIYLIGGAPCIDKSLLAQKIVTLIPCHYYRAIFYMILRKLKT